MTLYSKYKKRIFLIISILIISLYTVQIYEVLHFPSQIDLFKGDSKKIDLIFPFTISINQNNDNIIKIDNNRNKSSLTLNLKDSFRFKTLNKGNARIQFKLLGVIPIKSVNINVIDRIFLIPGGQAIGVKINTKGVLVVSLSDIIGIDGKKYCPAKEAGIRVGDLIVEIDGVKVKDADHVINILNDLKEKEISIKIIRNKAEFDTIVKPIKSRQDNCYRLGLWVRDKTAGIGTLTFYHRESKRFAALGHGITDIDTGSLMPSENGEIMKAKVSSIQQGKKGIPGEIRGIFFETENLLGKIEKNSQYGIYGTVYDEIINETIPEDLPVGLQDEIEEGKAYILTTTENNKIEKFEIRILKAEKQSSPNQKSMIIEVIDPALIQKTGGIVQGMSGSPIIQNGKIIGAVTHVFVNDPTKGYGLYVEWMLREAGIGFGENKKFALVE